MRSWQMAKSSLLPVALIAAVIGCTPDSSEGDRSASSAPARSDSSSGETAAPSAAASPSQHSVTQAPELDGDETLAARQGATTGGRTIGFSKGKKGDALIVAVSCEGAGNIKVILKSVDVEFPLECLKGEVTTTYNQVGVRGVERAGTISVQASSTVRWSMTIGRGEAAQSDAGESSDPA